MKTSLIKAALAICVCGTVAIEFGYTLPARANQCNISLYSTGNCLDSGTGCPSTPPPGCARPPGISVFTLYSGDQITSIRTSFTEHGDSGSATGATSCECVYQYLDASSQLQIFSCVGPTIGSYLHGDYSNDCN